MKFRRDCDEGAVEIFDGDALQVFLHSLRQPHATDQAAATDGEVEKRRDPPHGQRSGKAFEFVELACEITASDQRAD